jgi:ATP-dependent protease ClpP protease subunit
MVCRVEKSIAYRTRPARRLPWERIGWERNKERCMRNRDRDALMEISLVGELTEGEAAATDKLLEVPPGGECILYIDSPGGSPYCAMALMSLILLRGVQATAVVTGECSSAAVWPLAACRRRLVTPYSVFLFHPMKWQSEEHVGLAEAAEWARHFGQLETDMDHLLADLLGLPADQVQAWMRPGRYVSGPEFAAAGLAELVELKMLRDFQQNGAPRVRARRRVRS